jgi:hypothetical protein
VNQGGNAAMKFSQLFSLAALTFILTQEPLLATTFLPIPFPDAVKEAPLIVRGKIGIHYSDWDEDSEGSRRIYTYYEFIPSEALKGSLPSQPSITIRELGGEKDGIGMQIPGTAQFEKNEDVVIFLKPKNHDGVFDVHGMIMGKLNIFFDENNEEYLTGAALSPRSIHEGTNRWTLKALRQLLREQKSNSPTTTPKLLSPPPVIKSQEKASELHPTINQTASQEGKTSLFPTLWTLALIVIAGALLLWAIIKTLQKSNQPKRD